MLGCSNSNGCMSVSSKPSKEKNLVISFSLLMRLFEWCHEDAKDDVDMHKVMEKLVSFNDGVNPLTIDVYDCLIDCVKDSSSNDVQNAYELGQECAQDGQCLSSQGRDYSIVAGEIISNEKDNGCGASNQEIENFWQGYEEIEPLQQGRWTEMDMSDIIEIDREKPTVVSLCNDNEYCVEPCEETVDDDLMAQIEAIINMGKL